jgi:hypothetical protein
VEVVFLIGAAEYRVPGEDAHRLEDVLDNAGNVLVIEHAFA